MPVGSEKEFNGIIDLVKLRYFKFDPEDGNLYEESDVPADLMDEAKMRRHELCENVAEFNEDMLNLLVEDQEIPDEMLTATLRTATL